jgi:Tfp pilus assembly protein PilX
MQSTRQLRSAGANARRGSGIVMALVVISALMFFGLAAVRITISSNRTTVASNDDREAMALAEAGLSEAMDAVRAGSSGQLGNMNWPVTMGEGLFWVDATDLGDNRIQLVATGMLGSGRSALEIVIERPSSESPLFDTVINSQDMLTLNSDVLTDSFSSSTGTYASQAINVLNGHTYAGTRGDTRTNGDLAINARATIFGDAQPGLGGSITAFGTDAYAHGSTDPITTAFVFPPIDIPAIVKAGSYDLATLATDTLPAGDYGFDTLALQKDSTLRIEGPANISVNALTLGKDSTIEIDARLGPVTFYVEQNYTHTTGFQIQTVADSPAAVAFFIDSEQEIVFPSGSQVYGGYYAPKCDVSFASACEVWGSIAAQSMAMSNAMSFHYDEDLEKYWAADTDQSESDSVTLLAWFEREVTPLSLRFNRGDPFDVLGIDKNNSLTLDGARDPDLQLDPYVSDPMMTQ